MSVNHPANSPAQKPKNSERFSDSPRIKTVAQKLPRLTVPLKAFEMHRSHKIQIKNQI
jgi:hypothetical protein